MKKLKQLIESFPFVGDVTYVEWETKKGVVLKYEVVFVDRQTGYILLEDENKMPYLAGKTGGGTVFCTFHDKPSTF